VPRRAWRDQPRLFASRSPVPGAAFQLTKTRTGYRLSAHEMPYPVPVGGFSCGTGARLFALRSPVPGTAFQHMKRRTRYRCRYRCRRTAH